MNGPSKATLRQIDALFNGGTAAGLSDYQLLDRFARRRDEPAFAALVERHGPMVLGVCRRVLNDRHDAEDAFQATFLVLARKSGSVRVGDSLAPWLYGVAYRVAARARGRSARARAVEREASAMKAAPGQAIPIPIDLLAALDEELSRLPEKYRAPVVLCDLQGLARHAAAGQLRVPEGTLSSRLARARALLKDRLTRRGLAPSAGAVAAALSRSAPAAVPEALAAMTVSAATRFAAGPVTAGVVSTSVISLSEGVLKTMFLSKLKMTTVVMAVGLATTALALAQTGPDRNQAASAPEPSRLREVERKLDRVLEALGAMNPGASNDMAKAAPRTAPETLVNQRQPLFTQRSPDNPNYPEQTTPRPLAANRWGGDRPRDVESRLDQVERTLTELVDRVNRLEMQMRSTDKSGANTAARP